ncbi:NRDE family protein [Urechidicola croceus]|uniref:NRDE family protein n=1 Tax=Urechidicola croceus TaxID=1850246 RepID=A0A1D8P8F1_9FLAO|nr:NRDE family protein [Urechidicola croceus]AOW20822.1 hypothetical protein LPB138_09090 [Urechidicola croceus]
MCTVTFLPLDKNNFILTSSRDVPYIREKALHPKEYIEDGVLLTYPKDGKAGGTWIGTSSKSRLICLLNGGYKNHIPQDSYRKSRGLVVKELLRANDINEALNTTDLVNIEPFTLVILDWNDELELYEFVWTGKKKHLFNIPHFPHIWSSSTLYDDETKKIRQNWFDNWNFDTHDAIVDFHKSAGNGDESKNVLMRRDKGGTVSITSVKMENGELSISYEDVLPENINN